MTISLLCVLGVALACFMVSRLWLGFLAKKMQGHTYTFKYDAWAYMLAFISFISISATFLMPTLYDQIVPLSVWSVITTILSAATLYIVFMLDISWLLNLAVALAVGVLILFLPQENVLLPTEFSPVLDKLCLFALFTFLTRAATILNSKSSIFLIYALTICLGIIFISLLGGAPRLLGVLAAIIGGVSAGFFNLNALHEKIALNTGACISAAFLLSALLLDLCVEYAMPSAFILILYLPVEVVWSLSNKYLRQRKNNTLTDETIYNKLYARHCALAAIWIALGKIGAVNIILACFQLYAPNRFSLPFFTILLDLWLLNRLFNAFEPPITLKSANKQFIEAVKQGIKDSFRKE